MAKMEELAPHIISQRDQLEKLQLDLEKVKVDTKWDNIAIERQKFDVHCLRMEFDNVKREVREDVAPLKQALRSGDLLRSPAGYDEMHWAVQRVLEGVREDVKREMKVLMQDLIDEMKLKMERDREVLMDEMRLKMERDREVLKEEMELKMEWDREVLREEMKREMEMKMERDREALKEEMKRAMEQQMEKDRAALKEEMKQGIVWDLESWSQERNQEMSQSFEREIEALQQQQAELQDGLATPAGEDDTDEPSTAETSTDGASTTPGSDQPRYYTLDQAIEEFRSVGLVITPFPDHAHPLTFHISPIEATESEPQPQQSHNLSDPAGDMEVSASASSNGSNSGQSECQCECGLQWSDDEFALAGNWDGIVWA